MLKNRAPLLEKCSFLILKAMSGCSAGHHLTGDHQSRLRTEKRCSSPRGGLPYERGGDARRKF